MRSKMLLTFLSFGPLILQAAADNYWVNPSPPGNVEDFSQNPSYINGSVLNLALFTDYSTIDIVLWQVATTFVEPVAFGFEANGSFTLQWVVLTQYDLTNPRYLMFYDNDNDNHFAVSHYFNITDGSSSSGSSSSSFSSTSFSSSATPTSTLAVSSTMTLTATVTATSSPASAPTPTQTASTGLSAQAKIGVGVGVGLGALLILSGLAFFLWRRFGSNPADTVEAAYPSTLPPYTGASYYSPEKDGPASPPHQVLHNQIFEAADSRAESVHELEDSQGLRSR